MAFRKNSRATEAAQAFAVWRREQADLMTATGLPEHLFHPDNWYFFTEHGLLSDGSADLKAMTVPQKAALLRLLMTRPIDLETDIGRQLVLTLLDALEKALQEGYLREA